MSILKLLSESPSYSWFEKTGQLEVYTKCLREVKVGVLSEWSVRTRTVCFSVLLLSYYETSIKIGQGQLISLYTEHI